MSAVQDRADRSRRRFLQSAGLTLAAVGAGSAGLAGAQEAKARHYVLVHGAWHGAWAWKPVAARLCRAGQGVSTPTLTGLGERAHLASPAIGLGTHVRDVVSHLEMEDLKDVVLVGHSYAGMVIAGVLAAATGRVAVAVYFDAFVPGAGKALADYIPPQARAQWEKLVAEGQPAPPPPSEKWGELWGLTDPALRAWVEERIRPQSARTFVEPVQGEPMRDGVRYVYLKAERNPNPLFRRFGDEAKKDTRWMYLGVDSHHDAMVLAPDDVTRLLLSV